MSDPKPLPIADCRLPIEQARRAVAEAGGLEVCFNCGQSKAWDRMGLEGHFAHLLAAAMTSADAAERTAESHDAGRAQTLPPVASTFQQGVRASYARRLPVDFSAGAPVVLFGETVSFDVEVRRA